MSKLWDEVRKKGYDFVDDLLLIDELEDGSYRVFFPKEDVEETLETKDALRRFLGVHDDEQVSRIRDTMQVISKEIEAKEQSRAELGILLKKLTPESHNHPVLDPHRSKVLAAVRLITGDESVYHRIWGEVRHVGIDERGIVAISPMRQLPIVNDEEMEEENDES